MSQQEEIVSVENETSELPSFSGYRILQRVSDEKLWHFRSPEGSSLDDIHERIVDEARIIQIAQEEISTAEAKNRNEPEIELPENRELTLLAQRAVNRFVSHAVKTGWLSMDVVMLTSKLSKGTDLVIPDGENRGGLNRDRREDSSRFPQSKAERPELLVTESAIRNRAEYYLGIAAELNIALTPEQAVQAAVFATGVHEWSHSLEKAIATQYRVQAIQSPHYDEDNDYWMVLGKASDHVYDQLKDISMPLLNQLTDLEQFLIHVERFATGFELEGMGFGLAQAGLPNEDVLAIRDRLEDVHSNRLEDFRQLREHLAMEPLELEFFARDLRDVLDKHQLDSHYIPWIWGGIGYLGGYNRNQLKVGIQKAMEKLGNKPS